MELVSFLPSCRRVSRCSRHTWLRRSPRKQHRHTRTSHIRPHRTNRPIGRVLRIVLRTLHIHAQQPHEVIFRRGILDFLDGDYKGLHNVRHALDDGPDILRDVANVFKYVGEVPVVELG